MFEPYGRGFFVGYALGEAVATGAWRRTDVPAFGAAAVAEIKRMYVVPHARGTGSPAGCWRTWSRARPAAGFGALVLETGLRQPEAMALYEPSGYVPVPGFGYYRDMPLSPLLRHPLLFIPVVFHASRGEQATGRQARREAKVRTSRRRTRSSVATGTRTTWPRGS